MTGVGAKEHVLYDGSQYLTTNIFIYEAPKVEDQVSDDLRKQCGACANWESDNDKIKFENHLESL